jgi:site-specific DNA-methyltransferase (adenine-specific)
LGFKPAYEPICPPGSQFLVIVDNILKHRTGAINIDDCRIGFKNGEHNLSIDRYKYTPQTGNNGWEHINRGANFNELSATKGRWPANIILSHHPDCEYIGSKKVKGSNCKPEDIGSGNKLHTSNGIYSEIKSQIRSSHVDSDGQETVDHYNCHPDCPIKIMDEQSGMLKSGAVTKHYEYKSATTSMEGSIGGINTTLREESIGGASRFFYCAKASRSERNKGLENYGQNTHPTVKPVKIMQYLVRLITPPGGTCLDPFNGSGTTGIGCKLERVNYIGVDNDQENVKISIARIKAWEPEPEDYDYQLSLFEQL